MSIPTARHNLAVMYFGGKSIHKDLVLAYKWVLLDVSAEHTRTLTRDSDVTDEPRLGYALTLTEDIAKHMSKDEKKSGRVQAEEWIHSNAARLGEILPGIYRALDVSKAEAALTTDSFSPGTRHWTWSWPVSR